MATIDKRVTTAGRVSYRVRWREGGTRDGEWQSATFKPPYKKRDAELFKARVEAAGHKWPDDTTGALSEPGTLTVAELADRYLEDRARRVRSDRTIADYRRDVDKWIVPAFGDRQAGTLTEAQVQSWVDSMTGKLSAKSIADRHALLAGMFKYASAAGREWVRRNPCEGTQLPKRQQKAPKGLMPNEWEALYAALRQVDSDAADLALALLATGWRWSEVAAATTFDTEDYGDRLYLNMGRVLRRNAAGQFVVVEEGKGQSSIRRVRLDEEAAEMVRRRLATVPPGGALFTTGVSSQNGLGGSQWHYSNFLRRYWNPAVEVANLSRRPTPHWLRHTHVAWMFLAGASMPEIQSRIGHASIKTTVDVYGRMLTDVSTDALTAFAAMRAGRNGLEIATPDHGQIGPVVSASNALPSL